MASNQFRLWATVAVAAIALAGCREEEQDRVLQFEPGVYLGEADEPLDEASRDKLKNRMDLQNF